MSAPCVMLMGYRGDYQPREPVLEETIAARITEEAREEIGWKKSNSGRRKFKTSDESGQSTELGPIVEFCPIVEPMVAIPVPVSSETRIVAANVAPNPSEESLFAKRV